MEETTFLRIVDVNDADGFVQTSREKKLLFWQRLNIAVDSMTSLDNSTMALAKAGGLWAGKLVSRCCAAKSA